MASVPPPIPPGRGGGQGEGHNFAALISPPHQQRNNTQQGVSGSASANRDNNNDIQIDPPNNNGAVNANIDGMGNDDAAAGSANNNGDMFLFFGHEYDLSQEEFSTSAYYCTITNEYPFSPVHFGDDTHHVFEHSAIFRYISTTGVLSARRNVKHP